MSKITYLFGAGASRQALPIVTEIPERIKFVIGLLQSEPFKLSDTETFTDLNINFTKRQIQDSLIEDLKWLLEKSENHASIDTFAKKLFIKQSRKELDKLKAAFSVYFVIEHALNKADIRYDSFYASLLSDSSSSFPENVRILSWNYDLQFEKAYCEYTDSVEIIRNQSMLNVIAKYTYDEPKKDKFCILKLNGSTNILQNNGWKQFHYFQRFCHVLNLEFLDEVIRSYAALRFTDWNLFSGLSFAWERYGTAKNDIIAHAKNATADTQVLVVIGYSFPYFNREIDKEIIGNMLSLSKVYFQAPDANILKERFLTIQPNLSDNQLQTRIDTGQFLLPNEL